MAYTAVVLSLRSPALFSSTISKPPWLPGFGRPYSISISNARILRINQARCRIDGDRRILRINQARCRVNGDRPPTETAALFASCELDKDASKQIEDPSAAVTIVRLMTMARATSVLLALYEKKDDGVEPERPVPDDEKTPMWLEDTRDADQVIITTPLTAYVPEGYAVMINRCGSKFILLGGLNFIIPFVDKIESKFQVCYNLAHLDINDFELVGEVKVLLSSVYNEDNEDMKKKMEEAINEFSILLQKELRDAVGFAVTKATNEKLQAKINEEATFYRVEFKLKAFKPMSDIQNQARIQNILYMTEKKKEKRKEEVKILIGKTCRLLVAAMTTALLFKGFITKDWQEILINSITLVWAVVTSMS